MRIVQTLMVPIAAPVRKDTLEKESRAKVKIRLYFKKKQNNCSSQIIALLSNKLAEEFFSLFSYPLRIYCVHRY